MKVTILPLVFFSFLLCMPPLLPREHTIEKLFKKWNIYNICRKDSIISIPHRALSLCCFINCDAHSSLKRWTEQINLYNRCLQKMISLDIKPQLHELSDTLCTLRYTADKFATQSGVRAESLLDAFFSRCTPLLIKDTVSFQFFFVEVVTKSHPLFPSYSEYLAQNLFYFINRWLYHWNGCIDLSSTQKNQKSFLELICHCQNVHEILQPRMIYATERQIDTSYTIDEAVENLQPKIKIIDNSHREHTYCSYDQAEKDFYQNHTYKEIFTVLCSIKHTPKISHKLPRRLLIEGIIKPYIWHDFLILRDRCNYVEKIILKQIPLLSQEVSSQEIPEQFKSAEKFKKWFQKLKNTPLFEKQKLNK